MTMFACTTFYSALLGLFVVCIDGAVIVEGNADTQDVDDRQRSRFVRREPVGESFAEKHAHLFPEEEHHPASPTADSKKNSNKEKVDTLADQAKLKATIPADRVPSKVDMLADQAKLKAEEAERRKRESLEKAIGLHRELGVKVHEKDALAKKRGEDAKYKKEQVTRTAKDQAASGLPEVAFAHDAWFVDKEVHFANLLRVFEEERKAAGEVEEDSGEDKYCGYDYPLGHWNTSDCSADGSGPHKPIQTQEMCAEAARQANVTAGDGALRYFRIPQDWHDMHPKGCFMFPCHWDPGHVCYWFNDAEVDPLYPWGAPVCQRPLFQNGTADTNAGCPDGYDVIMNENNCTEFQVCKGYCIEQNFQVGVSWPIHNASLHNEYPEGCFIHKEQGCVFFNPKYGEHPPQEPEGIPVCNVTQITHFPEIPIPWDIFW